MCLRERESKKKKKRKKKVVLTKSGLKSLPAEAEGGGVEEEGAN